MRMDEQSIYREIRKYSYVFMLVCILLGSALFLDQAKEITVGIIIGTLCGIMGFQMIIRFSEKIHGDSVNVKGGSYSSYLRRYLACAYVEIPLLAVLTGYLCHKAAIAYYSFIHRKEDD